MLLEPPKENDGASAGALLVLVLEPKVEDPNVEDPKEEVWIGGLGDPNVDPPKFELPNEELPNPLEVIVCPKVEPPIEALLEEKLPFPKVVGGLIPLEFVFVEEAEENWEKFTGYFFSNP